MSSSDRQLRELDTLKVGINRLFQNLCGDFSSSHTCNFSVFTPGFSISGDFDFYGHFPEL